MSSDFNVGDLVMRVKGACDWPWEVFGIGIIIRKEIPSWRPSSSRPPGVPWEYTVFWPSSGMTDEDLWSVDIVHCKDIIDRSREEIHLFLKGREDIRALKQR